MKNIKVISIIMILLLSFGMLFAQAETLPAEGVETQPVATDPVVSEPAVTDPVATGTTDTTEPVTDATGTTDTTNATDPTATATEATEPESTARPTEYNEPSTYSDYVAPENTYSPSNQDYNKNDWEDLELDLESDDSAGGGDFLSIKNNTSKEDEHNPVLLVLCIVFWCLALSAITFMILYKPRKKAAVEAVAEQDDNESEHLTAEIKHRKGAEGYEKKYSDDYDDGF